MRVVIDTNVVLDLLLDRKPFSESATKLFEEAEKGNITAHLTSNSVTDIVYLIRKAYDMESIKKVLLNMFSFIKVLNVSSSDIINAFSFDTKDYEDAVVMQCAKRIKADYIVTRNARDFKGSKVKIIGADEFVKL